MTRHEGCTVPEVLFVGTAFPRNICSYPVFYAHLSLLWETASECKIEFKGSTAAHVTNWQCNTNLCWHSQAAWPALNPGVRIQLALVPPIPSFPRADPSHVPPFPWPETHQATTFSHPPPCCSVHNYLGWPAWGLDPVRQAGAYLCGAYHVVTKCFMAHLQLSRLRETCTDTRNHLVWAACHVGAHGTLKETPREKDLYSWSKHNNSHSLST